MGLLSLEKEKGRSDCCFQLPVGRHREFMESAQRCAMEGQETRGWFGRVIQVSRRNSEFPWRCQTLGQRPRGLTGSPSLERGRSPLPQTLSELHYRSRDGDLACGSQQAGDEHCRWESLCQGTHLAFRRVFEVSIVANLLQRN